MGQGLGLLLAHHSSKQNMLTYNSQLLSMLGTDLYTPC